MQKNNLLYWLKLITSLVLIFILVSCKKKGKHKELRSPIKKKVELVRDDTNKKIDLFIGGKLFTSYIYPNNIKKPVLYPIITPKGTRITRKYPLEPSVGERVDHPHHVGLWLNYGDVNGYDFWNNSDSNKLEKTRSYGIIKHREIVAIKNGNGEGQLEVTMDWLDDHGRKLLVEKTIFIFREISNSYTIDRITTLIAHKETIAFNDNKEGLLGIRVTRALEHPSKNPGIFTDINGKPATLAKLDNEGVTGNYTNSNDIQGIDCWGKRANWVNLTGTINDEKISLAILDHKSNVGYPTYWHTRGYGLFSANPLGQKVFSNGKHPLNFKLSKGQKTTFRHRIIIASSHLSKEELNKSFSEFSKNQYV